MVERLVANEKVEGSTPFARSRIIVIKSKYITKLFQRILINKDIRNYKKSIFYYLFFRIVRNFLSENIIVQIYNFKVFTSNKKTKTSYFLLKKCDFDDHHELEIIKKISNDRSTLLLDCGCNYGFYSYYTASLSKKNMVISVEASKKTSLEFLKNFRLNSLKNIDFKNKAISNRSNDIIKFNESENDWESSQTHQNFNIKSISEIRTITIDKILNNQRLFDYNIIIKLDIEGNEINAIQGGLTTIKSFSPIIIIEISSYIFDHKLNVDYLKKFLLEFDYSIYDTNSIKIDIQELLSRLRNLTKDYKTIGNYYLIKNNSNISKIFTKHV